MEEGVVNKRWGEARGKEGARDFRGISCSHCSPPPSSGKSTGVPCSENTPQSIEVVWVETCPRVSCPFPLALSISA